MAAAFTKVLATPTRLRYKVVGDGTVGATRTYAELIADMADGPLKTLWAASVGTQAQLQAALLEANCRIFFQPRTIVATTGDTVAGYAADVDTDAVTTTKAEVNIQMNDTTGDTVYLEIEYIVTPAY